MNALSKSIWLPSLLAVTVLFASTSPSGAQLEMLIECTDTSGGSDGTDRGFYVTNYPGETISAVTLYMNTQGAGDPYQVVLTVTEGAFDGPVVASGLTSVTLDSTDTPVAFQMAKIVQGQQIGNPPVTPGATLCFKIGLNAQPNAPKVFYRTVGPITEDLPNLFDPCRNVVQTNDTFAPLSTFRREGVMLTIIGRRPAFTDQDCLPDAYEMSVFGGLAVSDGNTDSDGDGDSDWEEFLGGTDPTDSRSKISLKIVRLPNGDHRIIWDGVAGRIYSVEYSTDLKSFTQLFGGLTGFGLKDSRVVNSIGERGFYRLIMTNVETIPKN